MRLLAVASVVALGLAPGGCKEKPLPDAEIRARWNSDERHRMAFELAEKRTLNGRSAADVIALLGKPQGRSTESLRWSTNCSGPGCYTLTFSMKDGRVFDAAASDQG